MEKRRAIGIDLGGTQLRVALVDRDGAVLVRDALATDVAGGPAGVIAQIRRLIGQICSAGDQPHIAGIGVSAPGPLDSETGTVIAIPTLAGWEDFPLAARLAEEFGMPVVVENDGIAAANGEWRFGSARGLRHFVYVTVSTGIGGGVVVDGRLLHGRRGLAGHVGHMIIEPDGPRCSCGASGCFEALASGSALARAGREAATANPASQLAANSPAAITARDIVAAARLGDSLALALLDREAGLSRHRVQQPHPPLQSASADHGRRRVTGVRPPAPHDRSSDPVVGHAAVPGRRDRTRHAWRQCWPCRRRSTRLGETRTGRLNATRRRLPPPFLDGR